MRDASGHFKLSNLPVGKQVIIATLAGYQQQEKEVDMVNNKGTEVYFELEKDPLELSQVVVTGTRTSHFVKDVPIRTEVLTSQAITKKNAQNLYEALEGVPGIRVEQQCQFCNFSEVRMQGLGAEHTQVLIDGEPIYSGLAGVYGLQQIGTNDIDRLEVVKGAGSACMEVVPLLVLSTLSQRNQPLSHLLMVIFSSETLASRAIRVLDLCVITTSV